MNVGSVWGHPPGCTCSLCPTPAAGAIAPARQGLPSWMPTNDTLVYTRNLIFAALLVIALPWVVQMLWRDPGRVVRNAVMR